MDSTSSSFRRDSVRVSLRNIWKDIATVRQEIRAVVEEVEKGNTSLEGLRTAEQKLLDAAAATASLLPGPFQDIPSDIIGEIAAHLLLPGNKYHCISRTHVGIWPLTRVCRSWRDAIISFPKLWSSFGVIDGRSSPTLLSTVLERSRSHPLSVYVSLSDSHSSTSSIVSLLVQHCRRWKEITLRVAIGPTLLLPLRGQLPQLEKLELALRESHTGEGGLVVNDDPWLDSVEVQGIFEDAPRLAELKVESCSFVPPVRLKFPFRQIRTIRYFGSPLIIPDDLSAFSNVSDLYLSRNTTLPITGPITFHAVRRLGLGGAVSILASFRLPSLASLELDEVGVHEESEDVIETFLTIHSESFKKWTLGTLVVKGNSPGFQLIDILSHGALKQLHTLTCSFRRIIEDEGKDRMSDILSILIWTPSEPSGTMCLPQFVSEWGLVNVMPRLRTLSLEFYTSLGGYAFPLIRELVLSRTTSLDVVGVIREGDATDPYVAKADDPSSDPPDIPTRLQDFNIKYDYDLPAVTMKDLNDMTEGKFVVVD